MQSTDAALGRTIGALLSGLRATGPPRHTYSLVDGPGGTVDLYLDQTPTARLADEADAVAWLLWHLNRQVVEASTEHLLFHAGGVQWGDAGALLPAPAGAGKSTLVAALVRAGMAYLSDEVVALDTTVGHLLPYPKPLSLKEGSFAALPGLRPPDGAPHAALAGGQWFVRSDDIRSGAVGRPCPLRTVVVPRYVPGARTVLRPLAPAEAYLALALNTVNLEDHGARGAQVLGQAVEDCDCYELELSGVDEACRMVRALLAA